MHSGTPPPTPGVCEVCKRASDVLLSTSAQLSEISGEYVPMCAPCRERVGSSVLARGCDNCGTEGELQPLVVAVGRAGERTLTRTWVVCPRCAKEPDRIRAKRKLVPWEGTTPDGEQRP